MCDFSLQHAKSRPAEVADKLTTRNFGSGTFGFVSIDDAEKSYHELTAVCVLPGTEIAFDEVPTLRFRASDAKTPTSKVARFRQINLDKPSTHHDALEFADGDVVLLTYIAEHQHATVLQLPAAPKSEAEAKAQERLLITA